MKHAAESLLGENDAIGDEAITVNLIDQLVEEDRDRFVTKVMMKIYH